MVEKTVRETPNLEVAVSKPIRYVAKFYEFEAYFYFS